MDSWAAIEKDLESKSPPKIVISVIGDSVRLVPKLWPKYRFKKALIHTIKTFGDSLVFCECKTKPNNACRVTKIVTEAIEEYELIPETKNPPTASLHYFLHEDESNHDDLQEKGKQITIKQITCDKHQAKGEFMSEKEHKLSTTFIKALNMGGVFKMKLPVVLMVVEGDFATIEHVRAAVTKNIPVILMKGSGMAADLLQYCLEDIDSFNETASLLFGQCFDKKKYEKLKEITKEIVQKKKWLLTTFDVNVDEPETLADKTLEVILKTWAMLNIEGDAAGHIDMNADILKEISSDTPPPPVVYVPEPSVKLNQVYPEAEKPSIKSLANEVLRLPSAKNRTNASNSECQSQSAGIEDKPSSPLAFYLCYQLLQDDNKEDHEDSYEKKTMYKQLMLEALKAGKHEFVEVLMDRISLEIVKDDFNVLYGLEIERKTTYAVNNKERPSYDYICKGLTCRPPDQWEMKSGALEEILDEFDNGTDMIKELRPFAVLLPPDLVNTIA